jgi:hypothetical protein
VNSRPSTAAPILAMFAIVVALLGLYVGGYFWLGKRKLYVVLTEEVPPRTLREFPAKWLAVAYQPMAKVESWVAGSDVSAVEANRYGE